MIALISAGGPVWGQTAPDPGSGLVPAQRTDPAGAEERTAALPHGAEPPSAPALAGTLENAAKLVRAREFRRAAEVLRGILATDPTNRPAKEMLAFALESTGDLEGERHVRSALAHDFPSDARIQTDYGRVLERSGAEEDALRAYRRARELSGGVPAPDLEAAIERMRSRTAVKIEAPVAVVSDPDARASRVRAGVAVPLGSLGHLALLGTRYAADDRAGLEATSSTAVALSLARNGPRASWSGGPTFFAISTRAGTRTDGAAGGSIAARSRVATALAAEGSAEAEAPWDEAAETVLHGGRSTSAEGHLYSSWLSQRLLFQAGARRRRLSVLGMDPDPSRSSAWQSLWLAGADAVVWKSSASVRGETLDERMIAPITLASSLTVAYRHYDVTSQTTPGFAEVIALAPRARVDEGSVRAAMVSPRGQVGLETDAGLAFDSARQARQWRAGVTLTWAPTPATRLVAGYEEATEFDAGLLGRRNEARLSLHANL